MTEKKMHIASIANNALGADPHAWLEPGVAPEEFSEVRTVVRHARTAERGKLDFLFLGDFLTQTQRSGAQSPGQVLEPNIVATAIALATERLGLISTMSATFAEPYNIARVLKSLDVVSRGRMGWNAVTTSSAAAAANYGARVADRDSRYARADEVVQVVQALWGSWGLDALLLDRAAQRFADMSKIVPINARGEFVSSRGPLEIPPSPQGQPVMAHAGGSPHSIAFAGRYADVMIGSVQSIDEGRRTREALRRAAEAAGRRPDSVVFMAGVKPSIGATHAEALARRGRLVDHEVAQLVGYLGQILSLPLGPQNLDAPLTGRQLAAAHPSPADPRSRRALALAREGWTVREVLHHSVIDFHPAPIGTAEVVADHMQEWFEAGAADGFWVLPDVFAGGMDDLVDGVVPLLQERGLFRTEYEGTTLRQHLGAEPQYGLR